MQTRSPLDAALRLIERWPIFPVRRKDKQPCTDHGFYNASRDAGQIKQWWSQYPDALPAIPTGMLTGITVLDVDCKNGKDGKRTLCEKGWSLPLTFIYKTVSGGEHAVFNYIPGSRCSSGAIGEGLDVRSDGGYAVAWFAAGCETLCDEAISDAPEWLCRAVEQRAPAAERQPGERIATGERNTRLTSIAGSLRRQGLDEDTLRDALLAVNFKQCDPPLEDDEVVKIAVSIGRRPTDGRSTSYNLHYVKSAEEVACATTYLSALLSELPKHPEKALAEDTITQLSILRQGDPNSYKQFIAKLGTVAMVDRAAVESGVERAMPPAEQPAAAEKEDSRSAATLLVNMANHHATLFCNEDEEGYAIVPVAAHRECYRLHSRSFRSWLKQNFWQQEKKACSSTAVADALETIEALARFEGTVQSVYLRVAPVGDVIYLDTGTPTWDCIKITADGWEHVAGHPVAFVRSKDVKPLPVPERGGNIAALWPFLNVAEDQQTLLIGWLLMALRGRGPFPVAVLNGENGAGKSELTRLLRALVDPSSVPSKSPPRVEDDLIITALHNHVVAYENLSRVPDWLSDALCRLSTGGGVGKRRLYTDSEEVSYPVQRPCIINGIEELAQRADLLDRSLVIELQPISAGRRLQEDEFRAEFEAAKGSIFGALLDGVVSGLKRYAMTGVANLPRMADFAVWVSACETGLGWKSGCFMTAYRGAITEAVEKALEASPFATALLKFMANQPPTNDPEPGYSWQGTLEELRQEVNRAEGLLFGSLPRNWPSSVYFAKNELKRAGAVLRAKGLTLTRQRVGHDRKRLVHLFLRQTPNK